MKWPKKLMVVRHGESAYNVFKKQKANDPEYQRFVSEYEKDHQSSRTVELAERMKEKYKLDCGDWDTPLTAFGVNQAKWVGKAMAKSMALPDVIFVSPHIRTIDTLAHIMECWPELKAIKIVEDLRLREQSHGLASLFNDWRIFQTLVPYQKEHYNQEGPYMYKYPQGESVPDVIARAQSFIGTLTREYAENSLLIVTHHLTILSFLAAIERWDMEEFIRMDKEEKPINCGLTVLEGNPNLGGNGKLEVKSYNEKLY